MATYQARIEDLIGTPSAGADAQLLTDCLTDSAKDIINLAPVNELWALSVLSADKTSNGITLATTGIKLLQVERENGVDGQYVICKEVPMSYERKVQDLNSMFYPTKQEPVFLRKENKIYVYPAPGADPNAFKFTTVAFPSIDYNESMGDNVFPVDWDAALVYGAALKCCSRLMSDVTVEYNDATTKAQNLIDGSDMAGDSNTAESAQYWLLDEDIEMVNATIATASSELSRAQVLLSKKQSLAQDIEHIKVLYRSAIETIFPSQNPQQQGS
tara:strand:- start:11370 stop:12185 length:816 start_codon:yes stop_codon:yes gene_type:complete